MVPAPEIWFLEPRLLLGLNSNLIFRYFYKARIPLFLMKNYRTWGMYVLLAVLGLVVLINFLGTIIEILANLGILKPEQIQIREFNIFLFILSLLFVVSGVLLWINLFKFNRNSLMLWHIFLVLFFALNIFKVVSPTYVSTRVPYYPFVSSGLLILIWLAGFYYIRKKFDTNVVLHSVNG